MAEKSDSVSVRVPYQNLKRVAEVELVGFDDDDDHHRNRNLHISRVSDTVVKEESRSKNKNLILSCTVAAGVQFGWALQLSLLTPYVQTLGIGHAFSSFIWLCGPITGLVPQAPNNCKESASSM